MRATIQRNDPPVHPLEEQYDISWRLKDLKWRRLIDRAWHACNEAMRRRIVIAAVWKLAVNALGSCPWLIRQLSISRIDDNAAARRNQSVSRLVFEAIVRTARIGRVEAAQIRLAVGQPANRRWWRCRTASSSAPPLRFNRLRCERHEHGRREQDGREQCVTCFHEISLTLRVPGAVVALEFAILLFLLSLTLEFEDSSLVLDPPQRDSNLPWTRENVRIRDRGFIANRVRIRHRVTLRDAHLVTVIVAGLVEPRSIVAPNDIH